MYFEIYLNGSGWKWCLKTANNSILSQSTVDYTSQQACESAVVQLKQHAPSAEVRVDATLRSSLQEAFRKKAQKLES
jgi:uncharacterized protein YegP (UPF0339 family)